MSEYTLGQRVRVTQTLRRQWDDGFKSWQPWPIHPGDGIVVGKRTLSNGRLVDTAEYDNVWGVPISSGIEYRATEHFTAYIVAYDLRRKHVLVRPEHMEPTS